MKHITRELIQEDVNDVSMKIAIEAPNGAGVAKVIEKARQFCSWMKGFVKNDANQIQLNFDNDVRVEPIAIVADKPERGKLKDYTFRVTLPSATMEQCSAIFNLSETKPCLGISLHKIPAPTSKEIKAEEKKETNRRAAAATKGKKGRVAVVKSDETTQSVPLPENRGN